MFKTIVFIRGGLRGYEIDMQSTVEWPDLTNAAMRATLELSGEGVENVLRDMGYPEAVKLIDDLPKMRLRGRFNNCDEFIFNTDYKPSEVELMAMIDTAIDRDGFTKEDRFI